VRVRRNSLRNYGQTRLHVEMPLPRLPAYHWSGYAPAFQIPADALRVTQGEMRYYFTPSIRRGKHKRGFCPECGSRITGGEFEKGDSPFVGVLASSLDDPSLREK
jgi:hypothetical protein